ncbi:MAG TPA: hypothetical protein VFF73_35985 [Planctomycetota bacterium]|nr:hypothetical protein [Planctomycetota bacterium]
MRRATKHVSVPANVVPGRASFTFTRAWDARPRASLAPMRTESAPARMSLARARTKLARARVS